LFVPYIFCFCHPLPPKVYDTIRDGQNGGAKNPTVCSAGPAPLARHARGLYATRRSTIISTPGRKGVLLHRRAAE